MSMFDGQFGSFGGGYLTGPTGMQTSEGRPSLIGSGGGYMYGAPMGAMAQPSMIQEVPIAPGAVIYAEANGPARVRQPGRQMPRYRSKWNDVPFEMPVSPGPGHGNWQGRY